MNCWRIEALVNTCLNWVKAHLASRVKKVGFSALRTCFIKSDLTNFPLFLSLLLTTSLLLEPVAGRAVAGWELDFNIEVSRTVILLKPWMKCQWKLENPIITWMFCTNFGWGQALMPLIFFSSVRIPWLDMT